MSEKPRTTPPRILEHEAAGVGAAATASPRNKNQSGTIPSSSSMRLAGAGERVSRTSTTTGERRATKVTTVDPPPPPPVTSSSSSSNSGGGRQTRGPRSLFLRRSDNGFGFTLRHFIVYPPESYSVLAGDRSLGLRHGPGHRLDEPMDTIFVKHVREKSAAHIAGLSTGDRIICVNGQSIAGLSYAQVVQLIQQSGSYLHLLVVPREDDLLQLYFSETAHNPYTNQRPWEIHQQDIYPDQGMKPRSTRHSSPSKSTMLTYPANSPAHRDVGGTLTGRILDTRSLTRGTSGSRRSSEGNVALQCRTCGSGHTSFSNGHAPVSFPACSSATLGNESRRGSSVERVISSTDDKRRESTASLPLNVDDSSPRLSIASSIDPSEADSVITRIKKSFEQKEEFLKRPNQPIWLPSSSSSSSSTCSVTSTQQQPPINNLIPREFYAHPQKFAKPLWPPTQQNGADSNGNAEEEDEDEIHYESDTNSLKAQFMCGGAVTNITPPRVASVTTDGTSLRPVATSSPLRTHHVHVHTTSPRPFVSTLTRITENQTTVSAPNCEVPVSPLAQTVSRRARQFESGQVEEDKTVLYRSELARLSAKKSVPDVAHRKQEFESKSKSLDSSGLPRSPPPRLQQKPQHHRREDIFSPSTSPTPTSSPYVGLSGNRVIPVGGRYVAFEPDSGWLEDVIEDPPPVLSQPEELPAAPRSRSNSVESWAPLVRQSSTREKRQSLNSATAGEVEGTSRPVRPTHLNLQNPVRPPSPPHASTAESVQLPRGAAPEPPEAAHTLTAAAQGRADVTAALVAGVQMRRPRHSLESDAERAVRRESYLKATWAERMHVDSDASEDDHAHQQQDVPSSPVEEKPSLSRLRTMFADRAAASERSANSEQDGVLREGWLHCKLSLQDGKRAADRSWKQVWAVLRGNTLHLRKERRDNAGHHSTPGHSTSTGEEQIVPLRGCLVDAASDYTKKKHVLRLHTPAGSQLLLQAEDPLDMARWLQLLRPRAQEGSSEEVSSRASEPPLSPAVVHGSNSPPRLSPQPAHKGIRKLTTSFRNRSPTGQSPVNKTRKPSQHEPLASPKSKTWKGRVAKQLRKIQGTSPSSPTAPHPEGATIGIPLEDCPPSSYCEYVPLLVELCTGIVEERGLDIIGIYRVPGNTAAVTSLTEAVNKGFDAINLQDPRWNDVNVISSLLKSFFRKLPDSLFTSELYPLFINSDKFEDPNARFRRIRKLVRELPEHHYETLRCLMAHLNKVVQHCASNKMEARNLAIVFGPTLLRTSDDNMVAMVTDMPHQCRIVESLISHAEWFFSEEEDSDDLVTPKIPSNSLHDAADSAADAANHSLLLNNIHKVEGYNSPSKEISAKDIVSSIISAANKKMQKAKTRRGLRLNSEDTTDSREEEKVGTSERSKCNSGGRDTASSTDHEAPSSVANTAPDTPSMSVASSILSSVLFSGNIVKSIHGPNPPSTETPPPVQATSTEQVRPCDGATIHTYAGLSANTQERIRRFEQETKAMLTTSKARSEAERRELDKQRIELEWQKAKHELEKDILEEIADNSIELRKHVSETGSPLLRMSSKPPVIPSRPSSAQPLSPPSHPTALAVLSSLRAIRRGNSAENIAALASEATKSPSLFDTQKIATNGTLKRLKTGKEQAEPLSPSPLLGSLRCGSLDSLHDVFNQEPRDRPRSGASDDGHDLLTSLTSTFDKKMKSLKAEEVMSEEKLQETSQVTEEQVHEDKLEEVRPYRDPSLHRAKVKVTDSPPANSQDCGSKVTVRVRDKDASRSSRKRDSGSGDRRSSTGGSGLSKIEKEARNNFVISPTNSSTSLLLARLKRKSAMHLQRGIKRRHTVGGCKDLARLGWENEVPNSIAEGPVLSEAQQQAALRCWLQRGRLRSSSPELSPRTAAAAGLLLLAAAELSQAVNRKPKPAVSSPPDILAGLGNIPLESHV